MTGIKKGVFALLLLMLYKGLLLGQNLVPNGSFERLNNGSRTKPKTRFDQLRPWRSPTNAIPNLIINHKGNRGYQRAAEGNNYCGLVLYDRDQPNYREYLSVKLKQALQANAEYLLVFQINAADESWAYTDDFGICLTNDSIRAAHNGRLDSKPQLRTRKYLPVDDTVQWQQVSFKFTAAGGERYLNMGNFRTDDATLLRPARSDVMDRIVYVYVDDIHLEALSDSASVPVMDSVPNSQSAPESKYNQDTESEGRPVFPVMLTPNGDGFNDVFYIANLKRYSTLKITNRAGKIVFESSNYRNDFNGDTLPQGKYSYELKSPDGNIIFGSFDLIRK
jgi:gliding motility-associated-like protein